MDELERIIRSGRETRGVEFKRRAHWLDDATKAKVVRAAIAMSNKRDGGYLIFGLAESGGDAHQLDGMTAKEAETFNTDAVAAYVNARVTPHLDLRVERREIDGQHVVAIVIPEFSEYPVICTRDVVVAGRTAVSAGKVYCRSRRMPESAEVQHPDEIREIIDLATEKGLARYFRLRQIERHYEGPGDRDHFDRQIGDL
jgi:predicted HTH transcriptional regulator